MLRLRSRSQNFPSTSHRLHRSAVSDAAVEGCQFLVQPLERSKSAPVERKEAIMLKDLVPLRRSPTLDIGGSVLDSAIKLPCPSFRSQSGTSRQLALGVVTLDIVEHEMQPTAYPRPLQQNQRMLDTLFRHGLVPDPCTFHLRGRDGYSGQPVVFSFLETAYDPNGDPDGRLYACLAPGVDNDQVLVILTQVPLFELFFSILGELPALLGREGTDGASCLEKLAEKLCHHDVKNMQPREEMVLKLSPEIVLTVPSGLPAAASQNINRDEAHWTATWTLRWLLEHRPHILGDELVTLLALALQEQRVLFMLDDGRDPEVANKAALLLHALLFPFNWRHLFLSAAVPPKALQFEISECIVPFIATRQDLPETCVSMRDLPPLVVGAKVTDRLELGGRPMERRCRLCDCWSKPQAKAPREESFEVERFPAHRRICKQLRKLKGDFLKGRLDKEHAASQIHLLLRGVVQGVADVTRCYAQKCAEQHPHIESLDRLMGQTYTNRVDDFLDNMPDKRLHRFYRSLYETQAFQDLFYRTLEELRKTEPSISIGTQVSSVKSKSQITVPDDICNLDEVCATRASTDVNLEAEASAATMLCTAPLTR